MGLKCYRVKEGLQWYMYLVFKRVYKCERVLDAIKHLYLAGIFIWRYWRYQQKSPKYETAKYSFEFKISNKWTHIIYNDIPTFKQ